MLDVRLCFAPLAVGLALGCNPPPAADQCQMDTTLSCYPGGQGWSCPSGNVPAMNGADYVCSDPATDPGTGNQLYCCATAVMPAGTCKTDDSVPGCAAPAIGFSCAGAYTPEQTDIELECIGGEPDPHSGQLLFCCCFGGRCEGDAGVDGGAVDAAVGD
jgi:hypothetical protein